MEYIIDVLSKYRDDIDNLCEFVLLDVIRHILLKKSLTESDWEKEEHI